eukprot:scaffold4488_cov358-Prasinococcus_capsulatus_cf.AAC.10
MVAAAKGVQRAARPGNAQLGRDARGGQARGAADVREGPGSLYPEVCEAGMILRARHPRPARAITAGTGAWRRDSEARLSC